MANHKRSHFIRWMVVVALAIAGVVGFWLWKRNQNAAPEYQTAPVSRGDLVQVVTAAGQLNPVTNITVGCQISGIIAKINADFNSSVTNGQIVAEIEPSTYQANLQLASAEVANAKAGLELAQVNARRAEELFKAKLIPASDHDTAVASLHQAEAVLLSKQATLNRVQVDLDRCTIYSPVDGIVLSRNVDVGQTVAASFNAPTLFIVANDLTKMQIEANVAEADIGGVEQGQNVDFTVDAFPYRTFHGKVVQIRNSPTNTQNVVTYDTVISAANPDLKLRPGMTANVSIIIARRENAIRIPNAALRFRPVETSTNAAPSSIPAGERSGAHPKGERKSQRTIYILKDNKPQPVQIKTGITDSVYTEVLEGLNEGDNIITAAIIKEGSSPKAPNPFGGGMRLR